MRPLPKGNNMNSIQKYIGLCIAVAFVSPPSWPPHYRLQNIPLLFLHGICDNHSQAERYTKAFPPNTPYQAPNFPDAQAPSKGFVNKIIWRQTEKRNIPLNRNACYLGQQKDVDHLLSHPILHNQNEPKIVFGVSRGARVAIRYIAHTNDPNVHALILDSGPNDLLHKARMLKKRFPVLSKPSSIMKLAFPAFDPTEPCTSNYISHIHNKQLPVFIVHCKTDTRVPYTDSLEMYQEFCKQGFTNVYLVLLDAGRHTFVLTDTDSKREALQYLQAIHSFYKAYGYNYNPDYAILSPKELQETYQPTLQTIAHELKNTSPSKIAKKTIP